MRRGGRVFLLLGIVILALLAVAALFFLPGLTNPTPQQTQQLLTPTAVPLKKIVVANIDIPNNTVLTDTETFLRLEDIPETEFNANPNQFFTSAGELQNFVTLRTILATERITRRDVVEAGLSLKIPPGRAGQPRPKAIVFEVDNLRGVADQVRPGDFVDLIASFDVARTSIRPSTGAGAAGGGETPTAGVAFVETEFISQSTKTLVQNVQVLDIRKPAVVEPQGTPEPGGVVQAPPPAEGPPQTGPDGQPAQPNVAGTVGPNNYVPGARWLIVLAVTDQQAEVIRYALERSTNFSLVLRGRGDGEIENTLGVTIDILIGRYGLPVPVPVGPAVGPVTQLTPLPATPVPPTVTP